ncbi:glycosyltransferase family 2 protein [Ferribacterium limneticum]|uniref:glycosyltransferase family 2 protein n=1 Tax=Ferribacterium limneticum TaxID=76259 RepID=UPI001CF842FD|nr:glycosyltransferase [Ferribacterium limneticum]UCV24548.1 glycosyltransferase [Ferribacterium limneticum]
MNPASDVQVDVIILSWNRPDDTIAAIASAAEQEGVVQRILIVDQGSEADNLCQLEAYLAGVPNATLKKLGRNSGVAGGRNIASAMGCAPIIVALDSDAIFADCHVLAVAVAHLDSHPELCAIGFRIDNYYTGENDAAAWDYPPGCRPDTGFPTTRFMGGGHALRRSVFEAVGAYDDRLFFCGEEVDLCYRMLNTGYRIAYVPEVAIRHKSSPEERVVWGRGRYYYTVRNNLYSAYKFGTPLPRLLLGASAFVVRGVRNRVLPSALRGLVDALGMCRAYRQGLNLEKRNGGFGNPVYALNRETRRYIRQCEPTRQEPLFAKVLRQFTRLPN